MTGDRLTVIVICSVLSSLTSYSSNATELMMLNSRSATDMASASDSWIERKDSTASNYSKINCCQTNIELAQSSEIKPLKQKEIWIGTAPQQTSSNSYSDTESSPIINRRLFLVAMAVTSAISIFLVWILFKKPLPEPETLAILPGNQQPENNLELKVGNELSREQKILPTSSVSEFSQNRVLAGKNSNSLERHKSTAASSALGKIVITKKNSQTVNIDVVSELIKDLQQNEQFQNLANSSRPSLSGQAKRNLRRKAIWELAKVGDHRSLEPLAKIMSQADSVNKSLISQAIMQIANRSFKPINNELFVLLEDKNPEVRKIAIRDLTTLYKFASQITKRLVKMQSDPDSEVRQTATEALKQLRFNSVSPSSDDYPSNGIKNSGRDERGKANMHLVSNLLEKNELDLDC